MSNLTRLQAVSSSLDTAIGKANSLPNAGSGGGGASVETCTVTVTVPINILRYGLTKYVNGTLVCESDSGYGKSELTFDDVVKGSCLSVISLGATGASGVSATNCTVVSRLTYDFEDIAVIYFQVNG